jgi:hypothetical protein
MYAKGPSGRNDAIFRRPKDRLWVPNPFTWIMNRRHFLRAAGTVSAVAALGLRQPTWAAENSLVFNLDPSLDNARNSEGAFVTLKSGRILFLYTQF